MVRYKIAYDHEILGKSQEGDIPSAVREAISSVQPNAQFYMHSASRRFVVVELTDDATTKLRSLEGILGVAVEPQWGIDR